jgi:hypothetical protein
MKRHVGKAWLVCFTCIFHFRPPSGSIETHVGIMCVVTFVSYMHFSYAIAMPVRAHVGVVC